VKGFKETVLTFMMFKCIYCEALRCFKPYDGSIEESVEYDVELTQPPNFVIVLVSATEAGLSVAQAAVWLVMTICSRVGRIGRN
jgi:hypothetical protein